MLRHYLEEMFEPTLLYGLTLAVMGVAAGAHYMRFSAFLGVLSITGTVLAQMSVNVISDYFDYSSGLDRELGLRKKHVTNLGGGSSLIAKGLVKPKYALLTGLCAFLVAAAIGAYLLSIRIQLLPILVLAALSILLYSKFVKKIPFLSEPLTTLNYALMVLGNFIVVSDATSIPYGVLIILLPCGILLGGNALYVNEVPDKELDRKYNIRHSVAMLRTNRRIGAVYLATQSLAYIIMVAAAAAGTIPPLSLACLVTFPSTIYVFNGISKKSDKKRYGSYLLAHTVSSVIFGLILSLSLLWGVVVA